MNSGRREPLTPTPAHRVNPLPTKPPRRDLVASVKIRRYSHITIRKNREIRIPWSTKPACDGDVRDGSLFFADSERGRGGSSCSFLDLEDVARVSLGCGWSDSLAAVENLDNLFHIPLDDVLPLWLSKFSFHTHLDTPLEMLLHACWVVWWRGVRSDGGSVG